MAASEPEVAGVTGRGVWVLSIVHPGAIVRGAWAAEPQQHEYLRRAKALAGGSWEPPSHDALIARVAQSPTADDILSWCGRQRAERATLAIDIECAGPHLVCIGFCAVQSLEGIVVRFRGDGGVQLWGLADLKLIVEAVYDLLADPEVPKWFHNGQAFDIPYLEFQGFEMEGYAGDTLLLQRYMFPEMGAGLQECASFYLGIPAWKWLASETNDDEEGEGK